MIRGTLGMKLRNNLANVCTFDNKYAGHFEKGQQSLPINEFSSHVFLLFVLCIFCYVYSHCMLSLLSITHLP